MTPKRHRTFFWLSKIAVLLIYIPFFAVQCFLSYSSVTQVNTQPLQASCKKQATHSLVSITAAEKKVPAKQVTINLNKRFQPGGMSYFLNVIFEVPVYFFEACFFNTYTNFFLPSFHLYTGALRGPPSVA